MSLLDLNPPNFAIELKTTADCDRARKQLLDEITVIEGQLVKAQERRRRTGSFADPTWFQSAKVALRYKRMKLQQIQDRRAQLRPDDKWAEALAEVVHILAGHNPEAVARAIEEAALRFPDSFDRLQSVASGVSGHETTRCQNGEWTTARSSPSAA